MKLVPLDTIFDIQYGNQFDLNKLESDNESTINFVSRSSQNLGVVCKVHSFKDTEPFPAGLITVTLGGTYLLSSFVQQNEFYTAQNIKVLKPKKEMSFEEKIYYCKIIESNRFRYSSHGREANKTLNKIPVPSEMPAILKKIKFGNNYLNEKPLLKDTINLNSDKWEEFKLTELFDITGSKTTPITELEEIGIGKYPFVTTQATNNGIEGFYDFYTEEGNVLTVDSAVLGYCSYQPINFSASDHVEKLIPRFEMNKYVALFLVTILNLEQYRYNYGRKCSQTRMKQIRIKLPSKKGQPDFGYMENFIKSLNYSGSI
jgi:hypothetical protein